MVRRRVSLRSLTLCASGREMELNSQVGEMGLLCYWLRIGIYMRYLHRMCAERGDKAGWRSEARQKLLSKGKGHQTD